MFEGYQQEVEFAQEILAQAAQICRRVQSQSILSELEKKDRSPVTVADFASQAWVAGKLAEVFPKDPVVAEEDSRELQQEDNWGLLDSVVSYLQERQPDLDSEQVCRWIDHGNAQPAERFWTLDPIDGTAGFLRGDQWVVALALIEEGQVTMAGLACPRLDPSMAPIESGEGSVIVAVRGQGSWVTPESTSDYRRMQVSRRDRSEEARLMGSVEPRHTDMAMLELMQARLGSQSELIKMDSQAKFAMVADGRADLILRLLSPDRPDYQEKIWDQAAGSLIVTEAGGQVTDLKGEPLDFSVGDRLSKNVGVLVSNGHLHQEALSALQALGAVPEG
ncbi:MAG: inositol monophosphatase family protein [Anaerolineales bacterium]